jgi:hypothetical protein
MSSGSLAPRSTGSWPRARSRSSSSARERSSVLRISPTSSSEPAGLRGFDEALRPSFPSTATTLRELVRQALEAKSADLARRAIARWQKERHDDPPAALLAITGARLLEHDDGLEPAVFEDVVDVAVREGRIPRERADFWRSRHASHPELVREVLADARPNRAQEEANYWSDPEVEAAWQARKAWLEFGEDD